MNRHEFISDKKKLIKDLVVLNGLFVGMNEAIDNHIKQLKQTLVDHKIGTEAIKEITGIVEKTFRESMSSDELMNMIIRVHEKHLTQEEVIELTEFLASEKLKKANEKMRVISLDIMKLGEEWIARQNEIIKPEMERIVKLERQRVTNYASQFKTLNKMPTKYGDADPKEAEIDKENDAIEF